MTEQEWRCTNPITMLTLLGRASKRSTVVLGCRAIWHLLQASRDAVTDWSRKMIFGWSTTPPNAVRFSGPVVVRHFALAASIFANPDASTAGRGFDLVSENAIGWLGFALKAEPAPLPRNECVNFLHLRVVEASAADPGSLTPGVVSLAQDIYRDNEFSAIQLCVTPLKKRVAPISKCWHIARVSMSRVRSRSVTLLLGKDRWCSWRLVRCVRKGDNRWIT